MIEICAVYSVNRWFNTKKTLASPTTSYLVMRYLLTLKRACIRSFAVATVQDKRHSDLRKQRRNDTYDKTLKKLEKHANTNLKIKTVQCICNMNKTNFLKCMHLMY